jgi:hypothetical protein
MTTPYSWHEFYKAAVLETDWTKMQHRIQAAESAMHERQRSLSEDHGGRQRKGKPLPMPSVG